MSMALAFRYQGADDGLAYRGFVTGNGFKRLGRYAALSAGN